MGKPTPFSFPRSSPQDRTSSRKSLPHREDWKRARTLSPIRSGTAKTVGLRFFHVFHVPADFSHSAWATYFSTIYTMDCQVPPRVRTSSRGNEESVGGYGENLAGVGLLKTPATTIRALRVNTSDSASTKALRSKQGREISPIDSYISRIAARFLHGV